MERVRLGTIVLLVMGFAACGGGSAAEQTTAPPATPPAGAPTEVTGPATQAPGGVEPPASSAEATLEPATQPPAEAPPGQPVTAGNLTAANIRVGLELVASGLVHPMVFTHANEPSGRMFIADQIGVIYVMSPDGVVNIEFLDLRDRMAPLNGRYDERGLLGLAFHPDYAHNGRFFVYYSAPLDAGAPPGWDHSSHISEFHVSADNPDVADPNSERILLSVAEPQANHNGGQIAFGMDGYLYIPLGDGGGADDVGEGHVEDWYGDNEGGNGQDVTQNLLGSILRIDPSSGDPYGIPPDNPFVNQAGIPPEQWAYGFRNPYRISFDRGGDHWLFAGDAGQNQWEEVSVVQAGGNYGWNVMEGTHCFSADSPDAEVEGCPQTDPEGDPLIAPVIEFRNINQTDGVGLTVVGGNVYRGSAIPDLFGMYVFGSWSSSWSEMQGQLFMAIPRSLDGQLWQTFALPTTESDRGLLNTSILSFGEDWNGELYVLTSQDLGPTGGSGQIWKIVPGG